MDKKQFYHQMDNLSERFTAVVEVPTKEELIQIIGLNFFHKTTVKFKCGLAIVSPKDKHYIKKLGREISKSRIEEFTFELGSVQKWNGGLRIHFYNFDGTSPIQNLKFECKSDRNKIYLTQVGIY